MRRAFGLYRSSVGKKVVMALSGILLLGFVVVHMVGNLKIYQGPEKFDHYALFLREFGAPIFGHGQFLWIARLVLLAAVGVHVASATQLWLQSRAARTTRYGRFDDLSFSYASRTMRWGGVILLAFVVYHLLHLTVGTAHPAFDHGSAYRNVVTGFRVWWVSAFYVACMVPLGLHMYHGLWSATQTLGVEDPRILDWRRAIAGGVAGVVVAGNVSIPLAVLAGIVR